MSAAGEACLKGRVNGMSAKPAKRMGSRGFTLLELFGDGHVVLVKRTDYLFPPRLPANCAPTP